MSVIDNEEVRRLMEEDSVQKKATEMIQHLGAIIETDEEAIAILTILMGFCMNALKEG